MSTIRDVAKLAEVSIASVSRILNQDTTYNAANETRDKVFKAAQALNYTLPEAYSKKKKPDSYKIGCIQRLTVENTRDSYYATILNGVQNFLYHKNIELNVVQSQYDILKKENLQSLLQNGIKGLLIMGDIDKNIFDLIHSKIKNIVGIDTGIYEIDNIRYDRYEAGLKAMQYLLDNGHRKIGFIGSHLPTEDVTHIGRYEAYKKMQLKFNLPTIQAWEIDCEWHRQICFDKTTQLLRSKDRPTAIFVASDHMAIASMAAIHQEGLRIPEDISLIGISDIEASKYLNPPLTTIAIPQEKMGEIASNELLRRINGDTTPPKQIFVPTNLVVRNSIKNIN